MQNVEIVIPVQEKKTGTDVAFSRFVIRTDVRKRANYRVEKNYISCQSKQINERVVNRRVNYSLN